MSRRRLGGKRAIVTGASSGIGRELACQLARGGVQLILTARRRDRLESLAGALSTRTTRVIPVPGDITDPDLRDRLLVVAAEEFGGLDMLVNNAGVGANGPFRTADPTRLRRIMEVNFFAPAELIRIALPILQDGVQPIIVNISSVLGHRAVPFKSEYCASKFALHGFSDALRAELGRVGVDVLLVSPSTTRSEFFDNVLEDNTEPNRWKLREMPAERVAAKAIRAIQLGRHEIILTPGGKLLVWMDRICPPLVNRLVGRFG